MIALRRIDPGPFQEIVGPLPMPAESAAPLLKWIAVDELVVDPRYQRDLVVGRTGGKNVVRIAREFEWTKFATVIVAPLKPKGYAIVDGQHRVTAAALRGIKKVPCQVVIADVAAQAGAFAAINANVTEMSPMQVHAAKVAAGDKRAGALMDVCRQAAVTVLRYPLTQWVRKEQRLAARAAEVAGRVSA